MPEVDNLIIPLKLHGIFSYFPTQSCPEFGWRGDEKVIHMSPQGNAWDPNSEHFAENEANLVDYEGEIVQDAKRIELELPEDQEYHSINVSSVRVQSIMNDAVRDKPDLLNNDIDTPSSFREPPMVVEGKICSLFDDDQFLDDLLSQASLNEFNVNVGATALSEDLWFESDDIESMSSATMASRAKGVSAEHLSKIWRISMQI